MELSRHRDVDGEGASAHSDNDKLHACGVPFKDVTEKLEAAEGCAS